MSERNIRNYRYLDFTDIMPEDDYLFNDIINRSYSENTGLIINWGRSFPWSIDDRLSLVNHFDEKTIKSVNERIILNKCEIIPLVPLFGGFEFLLSFPSYLYLRIEKNNCSILNPKAAGSVSVIESIVEDYKALFTAADKIALDMRFFDTCFKNISREDLDRFLCSLSSALDSIVSEYLIICKPESSRKISECLSSAGFKKFSAVSFEKSNNYISKERPSNYNCTLCGEHINIIDSGLSFYFNERDNEKYLYYLKRIENIWHNIISIKNELFKYQIFECSVRVKDFKLMLLYSETENIFKEIINLEAGLSDILRGKIKSSSICRLFRSRRNVLETELFFLKTGLDNYFIEPDNCF